MRAAFSERNNWLAAIDRHLSTVPSAARFAVLVLAAILAGGLTGLALLRLGPLPALVLVALPAAAVLFLRSVWVSFAAVIGVMCLLPYAVIPFSTPAGTPALIEIAVFASLAVTLAVTLCDRRVAIPTGPIPAVWAGLVGVTGFAFVLGYGRGYTPQTMHDFVKFLLAVGTFVLVLVLVRKVSDAVLALRLMLVGMLAAASLALLLYAGGPAVTERALTRLVPYGYPGSRIVRYIEDDPARPMRAVGTGVDPNSFGGLIMAGVILSAGQFLGRQPVVSRWFSGSALALCSLAMLLTYSRGAWIGAAAGIGLILLFRRRSLLPVFGLMGVTAVVFGLGAGFIDRLWQGFTLQDPATRLRLQEYQNAWDIIRRHPWFGVGFGDAGSIDLQEGVSSTYLTVASIGGLVTLAVFLLTVGCILIAGLRRLVSKPVTPTSDLLLTVTAAFAGMLVIGLVDHYFFNIQFAHMAALFWITAGLIVALARISVDNESVKIAKGTNNGGNSGRRVRADSHTV